MNFDTLAYFEKLKSVGFTEDQARLQADIQAQLVHEQREEQTAAFKAFTKEQEEKTKNELATKGDLRETELRLQKEIEQVRGEIQKTKYDLLKWQIGGWVALAAIMAKGFGWLGF